MASIHDLVDELELIAEAQDNLTTFIYDNIEQVNAYRDKNLPCLLVDFTTDITNFDITLNQSIQRIRFFFLNTDHRREKENIQTRQESLMQIAFAYFRKFKERSTTTHQGKWKIVGNQSAVFGRNMHNDKLLQLTVTVDIWLQEDCSTTGFSFND